MFQQEKSMKKNTEAKATQNLYVNDIDVLKRFMEKHGKEEIPTFSDAARVAIQFANAHGVLL